MKALLVTSKITFVPGNYDTLVAGLAACPQIGGLLILDNGGPGLLAQALGLVALGARGTGWSLLANQIGRSQARRRRAFAAAGKPVFTLPTINGEEALRLVRDGGFDLIVNARTRYIYKKAILEAPRLGCINVHHGLLPHQRGTMCDLWALAEGQPAGFSVHRMSEKIDAGEVLSVVQVSRGADSCYPDYLARAAAAELAELTRILARIEQEDRLTGQPNVAPPGLRHRRNPTREQIAAMRRKGLRL